MAATRTAAALLCFLGCLLAMAAIGALSLAAKSPLLFPAIGASAFLVFYAPRSPLSSPRNAFLGHAIGAAVGTATAALFHVAVHEPWLATGEPWRAAASATLALAISASAMARFDLPHPPAGATTLIVATGLMGGAREVAAILAAVVALTLVGKLVHRISGEPFPWWAPGAVPASPRPGR
ncbi:MAG: HPP family protein [Planctomycetaceae bacterium]|nr:HPP family protein [Planctomycetaceae bacterium]